MKTDCHISAIPTVYKGITFKSRLEARFAEWLDDRNVGWQYEPKIPINQSLGTNGYNPDFVIKWDETDLYIEVKPRELLHRLHLFEGDMFEGKPVASDLEFSSTPWICVDQGSDLAWYITKYSWGFLDRERLDVPARFDLKRVEGRNLIKLAGVLTHYPPELLNFSVKSQFP